MGYYPDAGGTRTGDLRVTVTGVRRGTQDEIAAGGLSLDGDELSATPYYLDVRYENTGTTLVTSPPTPAGERKDGTRYSALVVIDLGGPAYGPCPGVPERIAAGAAEQGCAIVLVPKDGSLDRVTYFAGATEGTTYWRV